MKNGSNDLIDRLGQAAFRLQSRAQTCDDASLAGVADLLMEVAVKLETERLQSLLLSTFAKELRNGENPIEQSLPELVRELNDVESAYQDYMSTSVQTSRGEVRAFLVKSRP